MFVLFELNSINVNLSRLNVFVSQCLLRFDNAARFFGDNPGEGVPELMNVKMPDAGGIRVFLDLPVKTVRRETRFVAERIIYSMINRRRFRRAIKTNPQGASFLPNR